MVYGHQSLLFSESQQEKSAKNLTTKLPKSANFSCQRQRGYYTLQQHSHQVVSDQFYFFCWVPGEA